MKIEIKDAKKFIYSIVSMASVINEARLKITKDGIGIVAMCPSNVAMAVFEHKASDTWEIDSNIQIGLNLTLLKTILKRLDFQEAFEFSLMDSEGMKYLKVTQLRKSFKLPILSDLEDKEMKIPQLTQDCELKCQAKSLVDAILDCDVVTESVALDMGIEFSVSGVGDLAEAENKPECELVNYHKEKDKKCRSKYSLEYLKNFLNVFADNKELWQSNIIIKFKKDYPLELVMLDGELRWILAPRVEND